MSFRSQALLLCTITAAASAGPLFAQTTTAPAASAARCMLNPVAPPTDADHALAAGEWSRAETLYQAQLSSARTIANFAGFTKSRLSQNKMAEALETAQAAAAALPASAEAETLIGDVLFREGEVPAASAAYSKALSLDPCSARAQFGIGRIADVLPDHDLAERKLNIAHKLAPHDAEIAVAFLATLPNSQRVDALRAFLASQPSLPPVAIKDLTVQLALLEQKKTCTVSQPFSSATIELDPVLYTSKVPQGWGIKVKVNNGAALLQLDSSVSGIVLSAKDAENYGVHALIPPNEPSDTYLGFADRIRIGSLEYDNCPVTVVPASALADHNSLVGTDFFKDHLIHIDFVAATLTLDQFPRMPGAAPAEPANPPISPASGWAHAYIVGNNILLPTLINNKGPYLFLLDTGMYSTVISPPIAKAELGATQDLTVNLIGSSAAIVKVMGRDGGPDTDHPLVHGPSSELLPILRPRKNTAYQFAWNKYADLYPISFDISQKSQNTGVEIGGLLGFGVLQNFSVEINYRDGLVRIAYDQNRRYWQKYLKQLY